MADEDEPTVTIRMPKRGVDALLAHLKKTITEDNINENLASAVVCVEDVATGTFRFTKQDWETDLNHTFRGGVAGTGRPKNACDYRLSSGVRCEASRGALAHHMMFNEG